MGNKLINGEKQAQVLEALRDPEIWYPRQMELSRRYDIACSTIHCFLKTNLPKILVSGAVFGVMPAELGVFVDVLYRNNIKIGKVVPGEDGCLKVTLEF